MLSVVACLVVGLVLVAAAGLKAFGGPSARAALATYGIRRLAWPVWAGLIVVEGGLGVGVAAGLDWAAQGAGVVMAGAWGGQGGGGAVAGRGARAAPRAPGG